MKKLLLLFLLGLVSSAFAQSGQVYIDPHYSDAGAIANVSGTYTDQSGGSYAVVKNSSTAVMHARLSWPSPGLTNAQAVNVQNPQGVSASLANDYAWLTWGADTIVILSYPLQPGTTTFTVNGVVAPSPSPTPVSTLQPGTQTIPPGTYGLNTLGRYNITVASASPTPTPNPTPTPTPTPPPGNPAPAVALPSGYVLAFDEEFNEGSAFNSKWVTNSSSVVAYPGSPRWYDEKPDGTYFFDAQADDGTDKFPYNVFTTDAQAAGFPAGPAAAGPTGNGYLDLLMFHSDVRTSPNSVGDFSGLLCSVDPAGHGFTAKLAYWEAKIWLPPVTTGSPANAQGLWPAFWLLDKGSIFPQAFSEIDIMEGYSVDYTKYHFNVHNYNGATDPGNGTRFTTVQAASDLSTGWHIYSCLILSDRIHAYLDGVEIFNCLTGSGDVNPMYVLVNFAEGGGWPDQQKWGTDPGNNQPWTNTTNMKVAYVRCWALPGNF
jgi:Glycosyl hydrolases family 16